MRTPRPGLGRRRLGKDGRRGGWEDETSFFTGTLCTWLGTSGTYSSLSEMGSGVVLGEAGEDGVGRRVCDPEADDHKQEDHHVPGTKQRRREMCEEEEPVRRSFT